MRIFKFYTIFLIINLFIINSTFSQKNFEPGYVINIKGDSIKGLIDYRNWEKNPESIIFKTNLYAKEIIYTPIDIIKFCVANEIYMSGIVEIDESPFKTKDLTYYNVAQNKIDTVFLQTLIYGEKSLFSLKDKKGKKHFFIGMDNEFETLIFRQYLKKVSGNTIIVKNENYKGQLILYFQDCPSLREKISNVNYTEKSLINLFLNYYECNKSSIEYQKKTDKLSIETGIIGGLSLTELKFKSNYFYEIVYANYPLSINLSLGLFCDLILPRNHGKWSIYNELIYTTYKVNDEYMNYESENNYTIINTTFGFTYIKLNNLLRFKYPVKKIFIYINGGLSNGFAISEINHEKTESRFYSTNSTIKEGKALQNTRKYEQGFIIGVGGKFKKYSFELRYERANGMSNSVNLNSLTNRYYFLLGYRF
ncbi:MAG: hypothetical protein K8R37_12965 [Bacteroidales bacterium]|nr:hypothetical protein [Bacteroidales bacterium]